MRPFWAYNTVSTDFVAFSIDRGVRESSVGKRAQAEAAAEEHLPSTLLVGFLLASRTGPCQETSKKHLMVITADDEWKYFVDGIVQGEK